jgi:hypothetical protein
MCACHSRGIGCRAGHHDLERALSVILTVPIGTQSNDFSVQCHSDPPAHDDDHRLAVHRGQSRLEVLHQVLCNELDPAVVEQWCVEAETAEEARELLAAGAGYRCEIGDCVNVEVEHVED